MAKAEAIRVDVDGDLPIALADVPHPDVIFRDFRGRDHLAKVHARRDGDVLDLIVAGHPALRSHRSDEPMPMTWRPA